MEASLRERGRAPLPRLRALSGPIADGHLAGTVPVDGRDRDRVPDDGWGVTAHKDAGGAKTLRAFAICVRRG